jgi:hypothetical protein
MVLVLGRVEKVDLKLGNERDPRIGLVCPDAQQYFKRRAEQWAIQGQDAGPTDRML